MKQMYTENYKKERNYNRIQLDFLPQMYIEDEEVTGAQIILKAIPDHNVQKIRLRSQGKLKKREYNVLLHLYLLERVCKYLVQCRNDHKYQGAISMKIPASFMEKRDILQRIDKIFQKYPHIENKICFQICETVKVKDWKQFYENCHQIHQAGVHLALDSCGSKKTEQSLLHEKCFDEIKIDKVLTDHIINRTMDYLKVSVMIDVGHRNGQIVSAENITDRRQYQILKKLGCDRIQGSFIGKESFL